MRKAVFLVLLAILLIANGQTMASNEDHQHDKLHSRVFVTLSSGELIYIDAPDNEMRSLGIKESNGALVNEAGRFLLIERADSLAVYSTGLFFEEHGDHYDLVATTPGLYWEINTPGNTRLLGSYNQLFLIASLSDQRVMLLEPEQGLVHSVPAGPGGARLSQQQLIAVDTEYQLVDIFSTELTKEATIRLPEPRGLAVVDDYLWIATTDGLEVVELHHYERHTLKYAWQQVPDKLHVHPDSLRVYALDNDQLIAVSTLSGETRVVGSKLTDVWAVDQRKQLLAVAAIDGDIMLVTDGQDGPETSTLKGNWSDIRDIAWVEGDLWIAVDDQIIVVDKGGHTEDVITLESDIVKLMVASPVIEDNITDHDHYQDHGHHHHD